MGVYRLNATDQFLIKFVQIYIVCSFHVESLMRLVKRLIYDFEIAQPMRSTTIQPRPLPGTIFDGHGNK